MSAPFELLLPDPNTYTIVINERQRKLIQLALDELIVNREDYTDDQVEEGEDEVLEFLADMFNPEGSTGPLAISPAVNGFVL